MRKFLIIGALFASGCAMGLVEEVEGTLDEIETTLDDLHTSQCIRVCTDTAEICLDYANGQCVDTCETNGLDCDSEYAVCFTDAVEACSHLFDPTLCVEEKLGECSDCEGEEGDCKQECGSIAQGCLVTDANCVADCVQEMEDALKGLDLKK